MPGKVVRILGIRGVPANHGGFETFAEYLSLYLVEKGWKVTVYCQHEGSGLVYEDMWRGVHRIHIPVKKDNARSTVVFDWRTIKHAARSNELCLMLGYNTALFSVALRLRGIPLVINMDGIEWSRAKWGTMAKTWLAINELAGCWMATHLVADHPAIKVHLSTRVNAKKITTIAYGADQLNQIPDDAVRAVGLEPENYLTVIARPEPENSLLEIVTGFSARPRGVKLAVLGNYSAEVPYQCAVRKAASQEVKFLGAIYDKPIIQALRYHSCAYLHGHRVGGSNPSLIEAMAAGNAVIAHDNRFNRWVAGEDARYFSDAAQLDSLLNTLLNDPAQIQVMRSSCRARAANEFSWERILGAYEEMLNRHLH
jgi:glycosyltransferase involved in cell wall biosynthesis